MIQIPLNNTNFIVRRRISMQTEKIIEEFKKIDVCCVSDAADRIGINCALYGIKPVVAGTSFCG